MNIWKVSQSPKFFSDKENIDLFERRCVCVHPKTAAKGKSSVSQGEDFCNVKRGDYFYLCYGNNCIRLFGMFIGKGQFCKIKGKEDWFEQKYELYYESKLTQKYQGQGGWWTPTDNSTFTKVSDNENFENWILMPFFSKTLDDVKKLTSMKIYEPLLTTNHNLILTGAPGTGKTYLAKQIAQQMIFGEIKKKMTSAEEVQFNEQYGFVQFHPSYDYTDFVEGLRPIQDEDGNVGFERKDGVFKEFCKKALPKYTLESCYSQLIQDIKSKEYSIEKKNGDRENSLSIDDKNRIRWQEKDNPAKIADNFVSLDNLKVLYKKYDTLEKWDNAKIDEIRDTLHKAVDSTYYWAVMNDILHRMEKKKYVFIIDEINRGEISKIFGELFFSIDPGYRGIDGKVKTQYQNLIEKNDEFYDGFFVPENVYIIGTMNDIDRSVESMDFAFRRRFAFIEIKATERETMLEDLKWKDEAIKRMRSLNTQIGNTDSLSSAYHIGPAYFLKLKNYNGDFNQLWENHLEGLLREYLRGMQDVEIKIDKLKKAYGYPSNSNND